MNPDVLLLLISLADEWEGKITGASQGGPARCPATQELPNSPPQLAQQRQQIRARASAFLHVASTCQTTERQSRRVDRQSLLLAGGPAPQSDGRQTHDFIAQFHLSSCSVSLCVSHEGCNDFILAFKKLNLGVKIIVIN